MYLPSGRASRPGGQDPIRRINKPWSYADVRLSQPLLQGFTLCLGAGLVFLAGG